jgi:hypothetical protein
VDGIAGVFAIDTSNNGSLLLIAHSATHRGRYGRYHATIPYGGKPVGNTHRSDGSRRTNVMARCGWKSCEEVTKPLTRLSRPAGGLDADRYVSGNIGLGILK